jgi:hypothetical protein
MIYFGVTDVEVVPDGVARKDSDLAIGRNRYPIEVVAERRAKQIHFAVGSEG